MNVALVRNPAACPRTAAPLTSSDRRQVIQAIALQTFAELAIGLAVASLVVVFAAPAGASLFFTVMLIQCLFNLAVRTVGLFAEAKAQKGGREARDYENTAKLCQMIAPLSFALVSGLNIQIVIHEGGHALAAHAVYKNGRPKITLIPNQGGYTSFYPEKLSPLGKRLGANRAIGLVTAAGPLSSLAVSAAALATGLTLKEESPEVSSYLQTYALLDYAHHTFYALSALVTPKTQLSHDFVRLGLMGLHPAAAAAGILAIPILIYASASLANR